MVSDGFVAKDPGSDTRFDVAGPIDPELDSTYVCSMTSVINSLESIVVTLLIISDVIVALVYLLLKVQFIKIQEHLQLVTIDDLIVIIIKSFFILIFHLR